MKVNDKIPELILKDQNNQDIQKAILYALLEKLVDLEVSCRSLSEKTYGLWK